MTPTEPRYLPQYRHDEIRLIIECAFRGESICFVGIAGVGKSNVINYLRKNRFEQPQSASSTAPTLYCIVDVTTWQRNPVSLWQLMDNALRIQTAALTPTFQDGTIVSIAEEERVLNRLSSRIGWACQDLGYRVMFVLDDSDALFEAGPRPMIEQLNTLRSDGNRGKLSYLIFTKKLPHVLGRSYDLASSKFFDLIRHTHYSLEPYTSHDADQMLKHLNSTVVNPLNPEYLPLILGLAGGHARLMRILFDLWSSEGPPPADSAFEYLSANVDVQQECERVFNGLHRAEQEAALLIARNAHTSAHASLVNHLERRGLLVRSESSGQLRWFSRLMERYLTTHVRQGGNP
jgi:hypothetical protein